MCGFLARIIVTYAYIFFCSYSSKPRSSPSTPLQCSPTTNKLVHSFGSMFMPDYYPCRIARLVSCYALFK
nr:hypothetical protein [uncultured bacterium]